MQFIDLLDVVVVVVAAAAYCSSDAIRISFMAMQLSGFCIHYA